MTCMYPDCENAALPTGVYCPDHAKSPTAAEPVWDTPPRSCDHIFAFLRRESSIGRDEDVFFCRKCLEKRRMPV
jgi:hypothetical protein